MKHGDNKKTYSDIFDMPHHVSHAYPHMSIGERAMQFSPFAALTGFDDEVDEEARVTENRDELSEDQKAEIDEKLRILEAFAEEAPHIKITYFVPDEKKSGGSYVSLIGRFKRIKEIERTVVVAERTEIEIDRIRKVDSPLFERFGL